MPGVLAGRAPEAAPLPNRATVPRQPPRKAPYGALGGGDFFASTLMSEDTENQPDDELGDIDFVPESPELCLCDGEFWLADSVAFCERHNVDAFLSSDGKIWALVDGAGWKSVEDLVKRKTSKLAAIKRDASQGQVGA